jgi:hypothetical protein
LLLLLLVLIVVAVLPVAAGILDFHLYEFCCQWFTGVSTIHLAMFEKTEPSVPCRQVRLQDFKRTNRKMVM